MGENESYILIRIQHKPICLPKQTEAQGTTNNLGQVHFKVTLLVRDNLCEMHYFLNAPRIFIRNSVMMALS
jgi:hypothetical protein